MKGITFAGAHSWYSHGLRLLERNIGMPPKDEHKERVPYSSITHDFSQLYGAAAYGERTLVYKFEFLCMNRIEVQSRLDAISAWLSCCGKQALRDDMIPGYHFDAECVSMPYTEHHGVCTITATFRASPFRIPDNLPNPHIGHYPDVNGDGTVDATDAALILEAAGRLGAGEASGLTPEQEAIADADLDGAITATDAAIVSEFAALTGSGNYTNDAAGWAKYMQARQAQMEGVI